MKVFHFRIFRYTHKGGFISLWSMGCTMWRLIFVSFLGLGFAFYQLSGGSDFEPAELTAQTKLKSQSEQDVIDPFRAADQTSNQFALLDKAVVPKQFPVAIEQSEDVVARTLWDVSGLEGDSIALGSVQPELVSLDLAELPVTVSEVDDTVRQVTGNRVNLRNGPGTEYNVLSKLTRGEQVAILQDPGNGWLKLRVLETNRVGWLAASLVN